MKIIYKLIVLIIVLSSSLLSVDEIRLDEVSITANTISSKKSKLNRSDIKKGQIWSEKDVVRNESGVTVTEGGRSGNNGYAIRGVDSDRVSLKVDGMESVESFMPRYYYIKGMMNGNRNSTELENISTIEFTKGANSLTKGSGAIGGSVSMKTKDISDFLTEKEKVGFYSKTGYATVNNEFKQVTGAGIRHNGLEALFQYTYKKGNENKNYYSKKYDDIDYCGMGIDGKNNSSLYPNLCSFGRILPDNVDFKTNSRLFKLGYRLDDNFINIFYEDLRQDYFTEQKSNSVASLNRRNFREKIPYSRFGAYYEYSASKDALLNYLKFQIAKQNVIQSSKSNQYNAFGHPFSYLNDKIDIYRQYEFNQDRLQLDLSAISSEFGLANTDHIFNFGVGRHIGEFSNQNKELKYTYYGKPKVNILNFTYQQPVKSYLWYAYLNDDVILNDKLSISLGARFDKYTYKPTKSELGYENKSQEIVNLPKSKFNALTYQGSIEYEMLPDTTLAYSISTGFKAPRVEEMYFENKTASGTYYARNLDLKPEKAQNHELSISINDKNYAVGAGIFYSKYKDFIDTEYEIKVGSRLSYFTGKKTYYIDKIVYQQVNIDSATIKGVELNGMVNAGVINLPKEYYATFKATYSKSRKSDGTSLMATQPLTAIFGLGYSGDKLDLLLTSRYVAAKKPKDAMDKIPPNSLQIDVDRNTGEIKDPMSIKPHPFLSSSYVVFDLTAGYRVNKNFSFNVGVFNIFDRKYTTWENLRQLKYNGNQSYVLETSKGVVGLERYTSAGRNFAISFEARY
ncbi:TonB-dependent hemoglobin/transferrin/lactoferrin family receptor [Campylobacter sp. MOP51]|uniref:TonB-dependent hemoglobin/transferrin/lactoferrin family receptor n=1 Tax=Campylobacter canis TaxID=3378588 RepID=UPI003C52300D